MNNSYEKKDEVIFRFYFELINSNLFSIIIIYYIKIKKGSKRS